jgi:transcriptional regulator with XRE-family HTH domain
MRSSIIAAISPAFYVLSKLREGEYIMLYNMLQTGTRIRELREKKKMTQGDMALLMDCTVDHVSRCERGVERYSVEALIKLADIFDVSVDYLLCRTTKIGSEFSVESSEQIGSLIKLNHDVPRGRHL